MQKIIKRVLILSLIAVAVLMPKVTAHANARDAARAEEAWGNWTQSNWELVQDFCRDYPHVAVDTDGYMYFATMSNRTSSDLTYHTIGSRIDYIKRGVSAGAFYAGGSGAYEETRSLSMNNDYDYILHRISKYTIMSQFPEIKSIFENGNRVNLNFGAVLSINSGSYMYGKIVDSGNLSGDAFDNPASITSAYSWVGDVSSYFNKPVSITPPAASVKRTTSPQNIGLLKASGDPYYNNPNPLDEDSPFKNVCFGKDWQGKDNLGCIYTRANTSVNLTIAGYQPKLNSASDGANERNSIDYLVTDINTGWGKPRACYATYKDGRSKTQATPIPTPSVYGFAETDAIWGDPRNNPDINFADTNRVSANNNGSKFSPNGEESELVEATTVNSFATSNFTYFLKMATVSKNGLFDASNLISFVFTDDEGPTWDTMAFSTDGYSESETFSIKNIKDPTIQYNTGCGAALVTYKTWGNEQSEPAEEKEMISEDDLNARAGLDWFAAILYTPQAKTKFGNDLPDKAAIINFADEEKYGSSDIVHFQVNAYDRLGNKTTKEYSIKRNYCSPKTKVDLGEATYQEPSSPNKWYSNADKIPVSVVTGIDKGCSLFADTNYLTLTSDDGSTNVSTIACKESGTSTNNQQFVDNGSLSSVYSGDKNNFLSSAVRLTSADNLDGKKFNVSGYGTVKYKGKDYHSEVTQEKDGEKVCIDVKPPEISGKIMSGSTVTFVASDSASGLKCVDVYDENNETVIKHIDVSTPSAQVKMVKNGEYIVSIPSQYLKDKISFKATDNVGHFSMASVQNFPSAEGELSANSVVDDSGKTVLRIEAKGSTKNYIDEYPSSFEYDGSGYKVDGSAQDSVTKTSNKSLDYKVDVPDDVNTTDAPVITQETTTVSNVLKWNKLADVVKHYDVALSGSPSSNDALTKLNSKSVNFCSGYDHDEYKVWFVGQGKCDTTSYDYTKHLPIGEHKDATTQSLDVSKFNEGTYYIRICMRDKNGNPSGYGDFYFYNAPTFNYPVALSVTAVKDVNWKDVAYPLEYSKIPDFIPGPLDPQAQKGKDADKFSLGTNFTASNGGAVHNGYVVNYRIKRVTVGLASVNVKYEYRDSSGKPLDMSFNGSPLSYYDISEHTNYTGQVFNNPADLLAIGSSTDGFLIKHQVPSGTKATYQGTNVSYNGDVGVFAIFTVTLPTGESSPADSVYEVPLYTITMQTSAEDDISLNPVR